MLRVFAVSILILAALPALAASQGSAAGERPAVETPDSPENLTSKEISGLSLDQLFEKLPSHAGSPAGRALEAEIERRFHKSGSDTADLLFAWAMRAFQEKNYTLALDVLDQVIMVKPDFAEAWNKRATIHYVLDQYSDSLSDIRQTLLLQPRHFGALAGLGIILDASGRKPEALKALRRALEINPQMDEVRKSVERLEKETAGQSI
jgi:tetratricopeptide (TPR) repeat protein